jgi:predicted enzyme related to lactoylglutathione lyase
MWSHGSFHWNELMTHDVARAKAFYAGTIGWTFEPMPMPGGGTYWIAKAGDKPAGGLFVMDCPDLKDVPEQWLPYLAADDVDARLAKATAAGASAMREPFDVQDVGRIAILREPGGAMVGWMTPVS